MNGFIYMITNRVNNKIYIGLTRFTIEHRWKLHIYESKRDLTKPLYKAFAKYGIENFSIEMLEEVEHSKLNEREIFWIAKLDSFNKGYNASRGGQGDIKFYSDSVYSEIKDLYLCGFSSIKIGELYNISEKTVFNLLRAMRVKIPYKSHNNLKLNAFETNELIKLYKSGCNLTDLGKRYNVNRLTVKLYLKQKGVEVNNRYNLLEDTAKHLDLVKDFLSGIKFKDLESKYHSDARTIKKILVINGIDLKSYRGLRRTYKGAFCLTELQCLEVINNYNSKVPVKAIAEKFKVNLSTLYELFKKYNVKCNRYNSDKSVQS